MGNHRASEASPRRLDRSRLASAALAVGLALVLFPLGAGADETGAPPATVAPTTPAPTTAAPTTVAPTTAPPATEPPTTVAPTTAPATTVAPTPTPATTEPRKAPLPEGAEPVDLVMTPIGGWQNFGVGPIGSVHRANWWINLPIQPDGRPITVRIELEPPQRFGVMVSAGWSCSTSGSVTQCTHAFDSQQIRVDFQVVIPPEARGLELTNSITASFPDPDPNPANNGFSNTWVVGNGGSAGEAFVLKESLSEYYEPGELLQFRITISEIGFGPESNGIFFDHYDPNVLEFVSSSSSHTCTPHPGFPRPAPPPQVGLLCRGPIPQPGAPATAVLTFRVLPDATGSITNLAYIFMSGGASDDNDFSTVVVGPPPPPTTTTTTTAPPPTTEPGPPTTTPGTSAAPEEPPSSLVAQPPSISRRLARTGAESTSLAGVGLVLVLAGCITLVTARNRLTPSGEAR